MIATPRSSRTHRLSFLLAIAAASLVAACGGEERGYVVASPDAAETLARMDPEYVRSINDYGAQVAAVEEVEGAPQDRAIQTAIQLLADAIEKTPQGGVIDTAEFAALIRGAQPPPSSGLGYAGGEEQAIAYRRALEATSTAFGALAGGPYRGDAKVREEVKDFQEAVRDLPPMEELRIHRQEIVFALKQADEALRAIAVAATVPAAR